MNIRRASTDDIPALKTLYVNTILTINSRDYTPEQVRAWASTSENTASLEKRIAEQYFIVAETPEGTITGFASLDVPSGYLDLLYVHRDFQRRGVATRLLQALLNRAALDNIREITTDASLTARPFFEKNGFRVIAEQTVVIKNVPMINFRMKK